MASALRDTLRDAETPGDKFRKLEIALLQRMNTRLELHAAVGYALEEFSRAAHIRRVLEVTREAGLSRRRFAQLFREQVGLTPKLYRRLHRFQGALHQNASGAPVDWADVALAEAIATRRTLGTNSAIFLESPWRLSSKRALLRESRPYGLNTRPARFTFLQDTGALFLRGCKHV